MGLRAQSVSCDLSAYKTADGLKAVSSGGGVRLEWNGEIREPLRAAFAIGAGVHVVPGVAPERRQAAISFPSRRGNMESLARKLRLHPSPFISISNSSIRNSAGQSGLSL
jgi:hypothetical protein